MFHIALHFIVPALLIACCFRKQWLKNYLLIMATMLIDLDHLLADPIYDPNRCSIGFHPLHHPWLLIPYIALIGFKKTRIIGCGLVIHMLLDSIDCKVNIGFWVN